MSGPHQVTVGAALPPPVWTHTKGFCAGQQPSYNHFRYGTGFTNGPLVPPFRTPMTVPSRYSLLALRTQKNFPLHREALPLDPQGTALARTQELENS